MQCLPQTIQLKGLYARLLLAKLVVLVTNNRQSQQTYHASYHLKIKTKFGWFQKLSFDRFGYDGSIMRFKLVALNSKI